MACKLLSILRCSVLKLTGLILALVDLTFYIYSSKDLIFVFPNSFFSEVISQITTSIVAAIMIAAIVKIVIP